MCSEQMNLSARRRLRFIILISNMKIINIEVPALHGSSAATSSVRLAWGRIFASFIRKAGDIAVCRAARSAREQAVARAVRPAGRRAMTPPWRPGLPLQEGGGLSGRRRFF